MTTSARQLLSRDLRQKSILDGAAQAFARTGFSGTSMEQVASASGITKLIVYRHFASKDELYRAVLDRVFQLLAERLGEGMRRSESAPGLRATLEVGRAFPDGLRLLLVHAPREPAFAEYAAEIRQRIVGAVQSRMKPLRDPLLQRWAAEQVVSYVFAAVLSWIEIGPAVRDDDFVRRCSAGLVGMIAGWRKAEGEA
jgi:AcrR family transcriptional regulator